MSISESYDKTNHAHSRGGVSEPLNSVPPVSWGGAGAPEINQVVTLTTDSFTISARAHKVQDKSWQSTFINRVY